MANANQPPSFQILRLEKYFLRLAFPPFAAGENKKCGLEKIFFKPHFLDSTEHTSRFRVSRAITSISFFLLAVFSCVIRVWENERLHLIFGTPPLFLSLNS